MSNNTKEILSNQNVIAVNQGKVKKKNCIHYFGFFRSYYEI